jgi:short-subunit dehydrogenase
MREVALVTGASGGIGEDLARLLAAGGRDVVLVARSASKLQTLADHLVKDHGIAATVLAIDLADDSAAERVGQALDERQLNIDVLVNNAGFGTVGAFAASDAAEQLGMLHVNVVALTMVTRLVLPGMLARRRGRILNVASTAAFQPGPLMAVYYASKAYVLSYSLALTEETDGTGVTVTCLCPGPTQTGFQQRARMEKTRLFNVASVMSSRDVAQAGYNGMMAGKSLVIPGAANKIGAQSARFAPRRFMAKLAKALNADR